MKIKSLTVVALVMSAVAGFAQAEDPYIESTGVAGINTGYRMKPNSKIEVDFQLTTTEQVKGSRLFGADFNHTVLKTAIGFFTSDNSQEAGTLCWTFGYGDSETGWHGDGWVKDSNGKYLKLDTLRHVVDYDIPSGKHCFYTDGRAIAWRTDTPQNYTEEATAPVTIFSAKNGSIAGVERPMKARIFGVKIYEKIEGEYILVRDFRPSVSTGRYGMRGGVAVPGFKCAVTGGFIGSPDNYSTFSASDNTPTEVVNEVGGYVSTGAAADKEYIDTGYIPTDKTRCEIDYSLNSVPSGSGWLFSASGSGAYYGVYLRGDYPSAYYMHNGATSWHNGAPCENALALDTPRTVILDYPANEIVVAAGMVTNTLYKQTAYAVADKVYTGTIKLAGKYDAGSEFASIKIYGFRIFEAGVKKHDFRPCYSDGVAGLKCLISKKFISYPDNLAVGSTQKLSCGGEVDVVSPPYIQTDLTYKQYLNTLYYPVSSTRIELDYACAALRTQGSVTWGLFRGKNTGNFGVYNNQNGVGYITGDIKWKTVGLAAGATGADAVNVRRTVSLDNVAKECRLKTHTFNVADVVQNFGNHNMPATMQSEALPVTISCTEGFNVNEYASLRIYGCRIFENGELLHDYQPQVNSGIVGLKDRINGTFLPVKENNDGTDNPQVYGGIFVPEVASATSTRLNYGDTATLTATAPGAVSYRWFRNGTQIAGGENGTLSVDWRKGPSSDVYTAKGVYEIDGVVALSGASAGIVIDNIPAGFILRIK